MSVCTLISVSMLKLLFSKPSFYYINLQVKCVNVQIIKIWSTLWCTRQPPNHWHLSPELFPLIWYVFDFSCIWFKICTCFQYMIFSNGTQWTQFFYLFLIFTMYPFNCCTFTLNCKTVCGQHMWLFVTCLCIAKY